MAGRRNPACGHDPGPPDPGPRGLGRLGPGGRLVRSDRHSRRHAGRIHRLDRRDGSCPRSDHPECIDRRGFLRRRRHVGRRGSSHHRAAGRGCPSGRCRPIGCHRHRRPRAGTCRPTAAGRDPGQRSRVAALRHRRLHWFRSRHGSTSRHGHAYSLPVSGSRPPNPRRCANPRCSAGVRCRAGARRSGSRRVVHDRCRGRGRRRGTRTSGRRLPVYRSRLLLSRWRVSAQPRCVDRARSHSREIVR